MKLNKLSAVFLVSSLLVVFFASVPVFAGDAPEETKTGVQPAAHHLVATYFHNTFRCPTCHKIEELSSKAVQSNFESEIESGKVVWRVINVDEPENKHYNDDYQLYTKSLIISEVKDGKEIRWKNLEKVWNYVRDDKKFDDYVKTEINDWLKE